jgi:hypothetical protein
LNGAINATTGPLRGALMIMAFFTGVMGMGSATTRRKPALFEEVMHPVRRRNDQEKKE